jgi:SAM-dependent methyltransferase
MARIASKARLGFYPTPLSVVEVIKPCLVRGEGKRVRIYDPCCGTGEAISILANHLQAESFGVELDKNRAEQAKTRLDKVIQGDSLRVSIRGGSISCLFLNPPYDYEEGGRLENKFIVHTAPSLQAGGILVLVISIRSLNRQMVRYLASWFTNVAVRKFPEKEYEAFKQIVVFGKKKGAGVVDGEIERMLEDCRSGDAPELSDEGLLYTVPCASLPDKHFHFRNLEVSPEEMVQEVGEDGFEREIFDLVVKRNGNMRIRPAAPLRKGHLAILVASGMTDGLVEKNGKRLLIKGTVRKEKRKSVECDETTETVTETDVLKIEIVGLDLKIGELFSIQ